MKHHPSMVKLQNILIASISRECQVRLAQKRYSKKKSFQAIDRAQLQVNQSENSVQVENNKGYKNTPTFYYNSNTNLFMSPLITIKT